MDGKEPRALTVAHERRMLVDPNVLDQADLLVSRLENSGALPDSIKNGGQLMMVLLAGNEAGMSAMQAINSFYIVNGKVTIWGSAVITQLKRSGFKITWGVCDDTQANVTLTAPDGSQHSECYTYAEATNAGLTRKDTWLKYRKNMLRWKAAGNAVRFFCPEVLSGHYLKEELEADPAMAQDSGKISIITHEGDEVDVTPPKKGRGKKAKVDETVVESADQSTQGAAEESQKDGQVNESVNEGEKSSTSAPVLDVEVETTEPAQDEPKTAEETVAENMAARIDPKFNRQLHAEWGKLAKAKGWNAKQSDVQRKAQLKKSYGVDTQLDLTVEQGLDMLKRIQLATSQAEGKTA